MIVLSWTDIFGLFGLEFDAFQLILNTLKSYDKNGFVKSVLILTCNITLIIIGVGQKAIYYYMAKYIIGHVRGYIVHKKMNKEFIKLGLEPVAYWPVMKMIIIGQIKAAFDANPYKKLNIKL